jgi:hypothetical protein
MTVHGLKSSNLANLRANVSPEEWQVRVDFGAGLDCGVDRAGFEIHSAIDATCMNDQPHVRRPLGVLDWPALLRKLDRIDPGFRE